MANSESDESKPWFDQEDEDIFSKFEFVGGKFVPPKAQFSQYLESFVKDEKIPLNWKFLGRRAPTPENEETNELEVDQMIKEEIKSEKDSVEGFEFQDETNQFNLSSVKRIATPKGSAKKTKPNSLQSILSNIARHHKIDMLGTKDELKNKMKQQEFLQELNSNQSEPQNEQGITNEDFNQSSSSQMLQDKNINLQLHDIESSSSSQSRGRLEGQFQNSEASLENNYEADISTEFNEKSTSQHENLAPSDSNEFNNVQDNIKQLQIQHEKPPQSNLNFQSILKTSLKENVSSDEAQSNSSNMQESADNSGDVTKLPGTQTTPSQSTSDKDFPKQMDFDSIGMNVKPMDYIRSKEAQQSVKMLGNNLPIPDESKQDLSEFDFQMDD